MAVRLLIIRTEALSLTGVHLQSTAALVSVAGDSSHHKAGLARCQHRARTIGVEIKRHAADIAVVVGAGAFPSAGEHIARAGGRRFLGVRRIIGSGLIVIAAGNGYQTKRCRENCGQITQETLLHCIHTFTTADSACLFSLKQKYGEIFVFIRKCTLHFVCIWVISNKITRHPPARRAFVERFSAFKRCKNRRFYRKNSISAKDKKRPTG